MSSPRDPRGLPVVQHNFVGPARVLNATFDRRAEIRKALITLQAELQALEGCPVQVIADIKLRVGGSEAKEHLYTASITDPGFDIDASVRRLPTASKESARPQSPADIVHSPSASGANGRRASGIDDDSVEIRPFKRPRMEGSEPRRLHENEIPDELVHFLRRWNEQWISQSGWMFDTLNKASEAVAKNHAIVETFQSTVLAKMSSSQDALGQAINASNASTMAELANISKLIPWLEHCRKTGADKVQVREEKWRSSSASFHDQARKDREEAEKKQQEELKEQTGLLVKIAKASGVDADEDEAKAVRGEGLQEASLGAQLSAELNFEAIRAEDKRRDTLNIEDDTG